MIRSLQKAGDSHRFWVAGIIVYFLFHTAYRVALGGALGLDEAGMILNARTFDWGYGPQLPLYAWLQRCAFLVFGTNLFALALVKNALFAGMVLGVFLLVRRDHPARIAGLAAASLLLLPQIGWESHRALTHSVLACFSAIWLFVAVDCVLRRPGWARFLFLGVVLSVGLLSKYNFSVISASLFLAVLTLPDARRVIFERRLVVSLLIAAIAVALPYLWIAQNPDLAFASSTKFNRESTGGLEAALAGLMSEISAVGGFIAILVLVVGFLLWRHGKARDVQPTPLGERLFWRSILIGVGLITVAVLASGTTNIKARWLQPILILCAPLTVVWLSRRITNIGLCRLGQTCALFAVFVVIALPVHFFSGKAYRGAPYDLLSANLFDQLDPNTVILAPGWVAGNIYYQNPDAIVYHTGQISLPQAERYNLVWQGNSFESGRRELGGSRFYNWSAESDSLITLTAPYRFSKDNAFHLSAMVLTPPS